MKTLLHVVSIILILAIFALPMQSALAATSVTGYRLPWDYTMAYMVTGVRTSHTPVNGVPRQAIDFGLPYGTSVRAMTSGTVVVARQNVGGQGHLVIVDTNDRYCSVYFHLSSITKSSGSITAGQELGKSGRSHYNSTSTTDENHLHAAVYAKTATSTCVTDDYANGAKQREVVIIFGEVGRELNSGDIVPANASKVSKVVFATSANGSNCKITAKIYGQQGVTVSGNIWAKAKDSSGWSCGTTGCDKGSYSGTYKTITLADRPGGFLYSYKFRVGIQNQANPLWFDAYLNLSRTCQIQ